MEHDQFVGQVQARARLASRGDAERAIRATLETLAERISDGAAENLGAQLPHELGEHLRRMATVPAGAGDRFGVREFIDKVAEREGVDEPAAAYHARVVLEVVDEATTGGLMAKIREQLPGEFDRLFDAGSQGDMRADN